MSQPEIYIKKEPEWTEDDLDGESMYYGTREIKVELEVVHNEATESLQDPLNTEKADDPNISWQPLPIKEEKEDKSYEIEITTDNTSIEYPSKTIGESENKSYTVKNEFISTSDTLHEKFITEQVSCEFCNATFDSQDKLIIHKRKHRDQNPFACNECGLAFRRNTELKKHVRIHTEKLFACEICKKKYLRKEELAMHKLTHTGEKPFKCDQCDKQFALKRYLLRHQAIHKDGKYSCDECGKEFNVKTYLWYHKRTHTNKNKDIHTDPPKREESDGMQIMPASIKEKGELYEIEIATNETSIIDLKGKLKQRKKTKALKKSSVSTNSDDKLQQINSCEYCKATFDSKNQLLIHKRTHRDQKPFVCNICSLAFRRNNELKKHVRIHTTEKTFCCDTCGKKYLRKEDLIMHIKIHSGEKIFKCDKCEKRFALRRYLLRHEETHKDGQYSCDHCDKKFTVKKYLFYHQRTHSGEKPFVCDICHKSFGYKMHLNRHKQIHLDPLQREVLYAMQQMATTSIKKEKSDESYGIENATNNMSIPTNLDEKFVNQFQTYPCEYCPAIFYSQERLLIHKRTHKDQKPFKCNVCDKGFRKYGELKKHERIHTGDRPFGCYICEKNYLRKEELVMHMQIHTGQKEFKCDECDKEFAVKKYLLRHKETHRNGSYACDECGKKFTVKKYLVYHKKTHSGVRPYTCEICERSFALKIHLSNHKLTHSDEKRFHCELCDKQFAHLSSLSSHKKTHAGMRPFSCDVCNKQFSLNSLLVRHKDVHHQSISQGSYSGDVFDDNFQIELLVKRETEMPQDISTDKSPSPVPSSSENQSIMEEELK